MILQSVSLIYKLSDDKDALFTFTFIMQWILVQDRLAFLLTRMEEALGPDNTPNSEADTQDLKVQSETSHLYSVHTGM